MTIRFAIIEDIKRNPEKPPTWLTQQVPPNSTVRINGETTIIRSYFVGKNKDGEKVHYLIDDMGDAYHISQIRDYQTGLNPYEDFLKDEPKDIKPVKDVQEETTEETTEETAEETQDRQDEVKYSTVEEDETHEKTDEEWREEALAASKEKLDKDQARWAKQVDWLARTPKEQWKNMYLVMDCPVVVEMFGAKRLPVRINVRELDKILNYKHGERHGREVMAEALKQLPLELSSPAAVVVNRQRGENGKFHDVPIEDGFLVFASIEVSGSPINIAVSFSKIDDKIYAKIQTNTGVRDWAGKYPLDYSHKVITVSPREHVKRLYAAMQSGNLLYWNAKKGESLFSTTRAILTLAKNTDSPFDESSITKDFTHVNEKDDKGKESENTAEDFAEFDKAKKEIPNTVKGPNDLEEHIVNAYRNRNEVRYSNAMGESETHKYSESEVQEAFKGQNVARTDNGYEITFSNGNKLVITETGEMRRPDGRRIRGSYRKGEITLTDMANPFTLGHEKLHFAKECLYTPKEWAFIEKATRKRLAQEGEMRRPDGTYQAEIMPEEEWRKQVEWERKLPKNRKKQNDSQAIEYSGNRSKTFFTRQEGERLAEGIDKGERLFWDAKKGAALYGNAVNVYPPTDKENSFIESIIANGRLPAKH